MNSELYEFLMRYSELNEGFIYKAFEILMKEDKKLAHFIRDFSISDELGEYDGVFYPEERKIIIYPEQIKVSKGTTNKKVQGLATIKHEIEHARNLKRLYECRKDIESMIIRFASKDYAINHGLDYPDPFDRLDSYQGRLRENYEINPEERLVSIKSWKFIVNLLKSQQRSTELYEARTNLYKSYIRGYESNGWYLNPPTYSFLLRMGMYHEFYLFKKRVEEKQYAFDTRLMYGLPLIDGEEYDKKILRKVLLQKKIK